MEEQLGEGQKYRNCWERRRTDGWEGFFKKRNWERTEQEKGGRVQGVEPWDGQEKGRRGGSSPGHWHSLRLSATCSMLALPPLESGAIMTETVRGCYSVPKRTNALLLGQKGARQFLKGQDGSI